MVPFRAQLLLEVSPPGVEELLGLGSAFISTTRRKPFRRLGLLPVLRLRRYAGSS